MEEEEKTKKRIKIEDLPADLQISEEDLKKVTGGVAWYRWIAGKAWSAIEGGGCSEGGGSGASGVRG